VAPLLILRIHLVYVSGKEIKKVLLAMTYSPRELPPKYHRRWRA
jgi:hypothetical protein